MSLNRSTNEIKTYDSQVFTTEKFSIDKITNRVRLLTGLQDHLTKQFLYEVLEDFCEKTWILRKLIQVGAVLTEVDNESPYYMMSIDLTSYADGLLVHDINEIKIGNTTYFSTRNSYMGDPTGSDAIATVGPGAYIDTDTYIGPTTYVGATIVNEGNLTDGYHHEIVDDTTIKIWPIELTDVVVIPVIFKTSSIATTIPYILEDYYREIASGVIAEMRKVPGRESTDEAYHEMNYQKGISRAKFQYAKQYKGNIIQKTYFVL